MAKDDYPVLVVYFLAYLYDCLKKGNKPNPDELNEQFFKINEGYYSYIIRNLVDSHLISGVYINRTFDGYSITGLEHAEITPAGIDKLFDEGFNKTAKKVLKDVVKLKDLLVLFEN